MAVFLVLLVLFGIGLLGERRLHRLIRNRPPPPPSRGKPPDQSPYRRLYRPASSEGDDDFPDEPPETASHS